MDPLQATLEPMDGTPLWASLRPRGGGGLTLPRHAQFGPAIGGGSPKAQRQDSPTPPFEPGRTKYVGRTLEAVKSKLPLKKQLPKIKIQILKP